MRSSTVPRQPSRTERGSTDGRHRRWRFLGVVPSWLWPGLLAAAGVQTWFRPGRFFAAGDVAPFVRDGIESEFGWLWGHDITGAGSPSYAIARGVEVWTLRLVEALGGSPTLAQRLLFTVLAAFAAAAVAWCISLLVRSRLAVVASGLVVFLHPFWIARLPNPLVLLFVGYIGLIGGLLVRAAQGRPARATLLALATVGCSFLALNPPLLAVLAAWTTCLIFAGRVIGGAGGLRRTAAFALRAAPWVLLVNIWWLLPWLFTLTNPVGFEVSAQTSTLAWSWTQVNNSGSNLIQLIAHWAWGRPEYMPVSPAYEQGLLSGLLWVLPIIVLAAPIAIRGRNRRLAWVLLGAIAVLLFLSKGLHAPFSSVNEALYRYVPGFFLLREPFSKLGPVLLVLYAAMVALLIDSVASRRAREARRGWLAVGALATVAIVATGFPMWTGAVVPTQRPVFPSARVELPSWWRDAAAAINDDPSDGKLLTLPLNDFYQLPTTWGYYGVDHTHNLVRRPVVQRLPGGYFTDKPHVAALMNAVERAVLTRDDEAVPRLLKALGVDLVLVRGDLDTDMIGGRQFVSPDTVDARLSAVEGLERSGRFGPLSLYRVSGATGSVNGYRRAVATSNEPADVAAVTASVPTEVAVLTEDEGGDRGRLGDLLVGHAEVVDRPLSGRVYPVGERPRRVALRTQGALIARASVEGDDLVLRDAWSAATRGRRVVPPTEIARIDLNGIKPEALVVDGVAVELTADGALVQVPPRAQTISVLADAGKQVRPRGPSAVGDCNAKEDALSPEELGLRAVELPNGVRLSARAHQACVSWQLRGAEAGSWLSVRVQHRSVSGQPARLCLFDTSSRRCLPITALGSDRRWTSYRSVVPVPSRAGALRLYAYADGPEPIGEGLPSEASVTEYRGLTASVLTPMTAVRVDAPSTPRSIEVGRGDRVAVRGPTSGNVLGTWGALGDCHRYDSRSAEAAGLVRRSIPAGVELAAAAHAACVSAPVENPDASSLLDVSFRYRTVEGEQPPRVCLYDPDARHCLMSEPSDGSPVTRGAALPSSRAWRTFQGHVRVPAGVSGLRLYVYADGASPGVTPSITRIQYKDVAVRPVAPFALVIADDSVFEDARSDDPDLAAKWRGPARFTARIDAGRDGAIVATHESADPGWQLRAGEEKADSITVHGYRSGWVVSGDEAAADLSAVYQPATVARRALNISQGAVLVAIFLAMWSAVRRRTRSS